MLVGVAHALSLLRDWPSGLHDLFERMRKPSRLGFKADPTLWKVGGALCHTWLARRWMGPRFEFVQAAVDTWMIKTMPFSQIHGTPRVQTRPQMHLLNPYLSAHDAALILEESSETAGWLWKLGLLEPRGGRVPYAHVLALKAKLHQPLSWPRAAHLLGLDWKWLRSYLQNPVPSDSLQQAYRENPSNIRWTRLRETLQGMEQAPPLVRRELYVDTFELDLETLILELQALGMSVSAFVGQVLRGELRLGFTVRWRPGFGGWTVFRSSWHDYTVGCQKQ